MFLQLEINSKIDAEIVSAGLGAMIGKAKTGYVEAIGKLAQAASDGDAAGLVEVKKDITEYAEGFDSLGMISKQVKDYTAVVTPPPAPTPVPAPVDPAPVVTPAGA